MLKRIQHKICYFPVLSWFKTYFSSTARFIGLKIASYMVASFYTLNKNQEVIWLIEKNEIRLILNDVFCHLINVVSGGKKRLYI